MSSRQIIKGATISLELRGLFEVEVEGGYEEEVLLLLKFILFLLVSM